MSFEEQIHKELSNLPKYSLDTKQKQRILMKLTNQKPNIKKTLSIKPIVAILVAIALFSILILEEINRTPENIPHQAEFVEFDAPVGEVFTLSDTSQEFIGVQGSVALLNTFDHFVAKDNRRVAKQMIFYWGDPVELIGKNYRVEAMNRSGEKITIAEGTLNSPLYSEDAHTLTSFLPFSSEGEWLLSYYVEDTLHGAFTLNVLPPFPKTEHYTLMDSPIEFVIGNETNIFIESSWKEKKEIEVKLVNEEGTEIERANFSLEATNLDSLTNQPVYLFSGKLTIPNTGTWSLIIDGEKTTAFNK